MEYERHPFLSSARYGDSHIKQIGSLFAGEISRATKITEILGLDIPVTEANIA